MQSTSSRFQSAIRSSGRRKTVINVAESSGGPLLFSNIPITDGQLNVDRGSEIRRSGWIKIGESSLTDSFFNSHSGPFGMEIHLYHGIVYPNGSEELVKMGVFNIENFGWQEGDGGWPNIQIFDRTRAIQRSPFEGARGYSGKFVQAVIEEIVADVLPDASVEFGPDLDNPRLPGGSVFDGDRWEVIRVCCEALGAEAYFDVDGVFQVQPIPDPTATAVSAVWEFNVGEGFSEIQGLEGEEKLVSRPKGVLTDATRSIGRESTYNAVAVYGAAPSDTTGQPYAVAFDNDPSSPTYYNGPFGKSVHRVDNQLLVTPGQCAEAAAAELKNRLGFSRSIDFTAIGNPALDVGEYVLFTFSDNSQEVHLLDSYDYPLGSGEFSGSTKTNPTRQTSSVAITKGASAIQRNPGPPGKPNAYAATNTTISIKWSSAAAGTAEIARYDIYFNSTLKKSVAHDVQVTTVTGLAAGTTYRIAIRAVDANGAESKLSEQTSKKTTGVLVGGDEPTVLFEKKYTANWSRTYVTDGSPATWLGTDCYQGYYSGARYRSLIGFDDEKIRRDTLGGTIESCRLWIYFEHWYLNSGGTAVIGTHNYDNRPANWNNDNVNQDRVRSSGWPKPGGRWVNLGVSIGNNFRTGAAKGIALGPTASNNIYYGHALGSSSGSRTPILEIKYRS